MHIVAYVGVGFVNFIEWIGSIKQMDSINDIFSGIGKLIEGFAQLTFGLVNLIVYIIGAILLGIIAYLLFVKPLIKGVKEKGKRIYWFGLFFFTAFLLIGCPALIGLLGRYYGEKGMFIGFGIFIVVLVLFSRFGKKYENKENQSL